MKEYLVDVPVLLLFFNNAERFKKVFEQVRIARPSKLFLFQDGARKDRNDLEGILACRKIIDEEIDWDCEVYKNYLKENLGCDPSEYVSQKWAFSFVDKCIILEDDDVPSVSFFRFCKELLDKYEYDERISMIAGMNHEEITSDIPYDYFFTSNISIWGWATWKRVIDKWEGDYAFLEDKTTVELLRNFVKDRRYRNNYVAQFFAHKKTGVEYYESILIANMFLNSGLSIVPTKNMINNIGYGGEGVHYSTSLDKMPKASQKIFKMQRYEVVFPLKHPKYVIENVTYLRRVYKQMCWNHPFLKVWRKTQSVFIKLRHGDFEGILKDIRKISVLLKKEEN